MPKRIADVCIVSLPDGENIGGFGLFREDNETDEVLAERAGRLLKRAIIVALRAQRQAEIDFENNRIQVIVPETNNEMIRELFDHLHPKSEEDMPKHKLFGQILLESGIISQDALDNALQYKETTLHNHKLGEILLRLGYITRSNIDETIYIQNIEDDTEEQTGDLLGINLPPYEMPDVSYEELRRICHPNSPRRGVFPPSPTNER